MITRYKKEDIQKMIDQEESLYQEWSLIADKLRAIYNLFGWTHMLKGLEDADNLVEELTLEVLDVLKNEKEEASVSSAGLEVTGYFDEDGMVNLDYKFNLA